MFYGPRIDVLAHQTAVQRRVDGAGRNSLNSRHIPVQPSLPADHFPTQSHEMLFDAHARGFSSFGGIPRTGRYRTRTGDAAGACLTSFTTVPVRPLPRPAAAGLRSSRLLRAWQHMQQRCRGAFRKMLSAEAEFLQHIHRRRAGSDEVEFGGNGGQHRTARKPMNGSATTKRFRRCRARCLATGADQDRASGPAPKTLSYQEVPHTGSRRARISVWRTDTEMISAGSDKPQPGDRGNPRTRIPIPRGWRRSPPSIRSGCRTSRNRRRLPDLVDRDAFHPFCAISLSAASSRRARVSRLRRAARLALFGNRDHGMGCFRSGALGCTAIRCIRHDVSGPCSAKYRFKCLH